MDGDKFSDPRTRSQRGRSRGRRGRGGRGGHAIRGVRGRGRGRSGAANLSVADQPQPSGIDVIEGAAVDTEAAAETNAFRFEEYDALLMAARRDGRKQDVDLYNISRTDGEDDEGENNDFEDAGRPVDVFVADADNDDEGKEAEIMNLAADFTQLAGVLASAPLWARIGSAGHFTLNSKDFSLDQLIIWKDDSENNGNAEEGDEDQGLEDIMDELDLIEVEEQESGEGDSTKRAEHTAVSTKPDTKKTDASDDEFDKWLDNV